MDRPGGACPPQGSPPERARLRRKVGRLGQHGQQLGEAPGQEAAKKNTESQAILDTALAQANAATHVRFETELVKLAEGSTSLAAAGRVIIPRPRAWDYETWADDIERAVVADIGRQIGGGGGGGYTEFLRLRDKDGKKQKVDEALFHQHHQEVLTYSALFRVVHCEAINVGGGRADVLVTFPAARFNVECKIEVNDASEAGLHQYVAQPTEYQNTNPSFAILLALDKTVGAEGAVNLFDSVWIDEVQRQGERQPCRVVVIRVPGNRDNPNRRRPAM